LVRHGKFLNIASKKIVDEKSPTKELIALRVYQVKIMPRGKPWITWLVKSMLMHPIIVAQ
jgi:hypothetical protein